MTKYAVLLLLLLSACATYQDKVSESRNLMRSGQAMAAAEKLKIMAQTAGRDQLVYLLDYATALQAAGDYKTSTEAFLRADKLTDLNDYHSISNIGLAALGSETMLQYKGESYEKLLINASLALNYIMMNNLEDAAVEARKVNEKIQKIRQEGRKDYEQNPFANYLTGIIWEADQKWDDAYISYSDAYKIDPTNPELPEDLIRTARISHRDDDYKEWKRKFPNVVESPDWYNAGKGQLIILIEQGWAPEKRAVGNGIRVAPPNYPTLYGSFIDRGRYPYLIPIPSETWSVKAQISGAGDHRSRLVYDVEKVAIKTFEADLMWAMARKAAADVAKKVAADQVRQKNEMLGFLTSIALQVSDQADLRQWSTLPKSMQVIRAWLPPGSYKVNLEGLTGYGAPTSDHIENREVNIRPGHPTFLVWRTLR